MKRNIEVSADKKKDDLAEYMNGVDNSIEALELIEKAKKEELVKVAAWKKLHGDIFKISVGAYSCYLKKPTRKAMSFASTVMAKEPLRSNEILLKDCWLGGDMILQTDDSLFLSVGTQLQNILEVQEATLVKF